MKAIIIIFLLTMLFSCTNNGNLNQDPETKKYQDSLAILKKQLAEANGQIEILKFPADQRLEKIVELFNAQEYEKAQKEIQELKNVFPNAKENEEAAKYSEKITSAIAAKKAEEERIKAMGFKALPEQSTIIIDYNTVSFSGIKVGSQFTFDAYDDRWFYRDADRVYKYVSLQMSVTSTSHNPDLPQLAIYIISGDKMNLLSTFDTRFARWRDYGAYLGNYHDSSNDFSKVSTIRFKLGVQVADNWLTKPYAIVLMKKNVLSYHYDRFNNPPISYVGSAGYPSNLSLSDFSSNYVVVKKFNL